jgi:hypothetical protein
MAHTIVLDQSYLTPPAQEFAVGVSSDLAQTFTVGVTGALSRLDFEIAGATSAFIFDIRPTDAFGVPVENDGLALVAGVIPSSAVPAPGALLQIGFGSALPVNAGDVLAFSLRGGTRTMRLPDSTLAPDYVGGASFYRPPASTWQPLAALGFGDVNFRTYVTVVPEPSSVVLLALGLLSLVGGGLVRRHASR